MGIYIHLSVNRFLETLKYQNWKIQLEMNWKAKSLLKNVRTFFALLNGKNLSTSRCNYAGSQGGF